MSNLLPIQERRGAWSAVRARGLLAFGIFLILSALCGALALAPSVAVVHGALAQETRDAAAAPNRAEDTQALIEAQALLVQLAGVQSTSTPASTIVDVLAKRSPGMTISHITFTAGTFPTLSFVGSALKGDDINTFRAAVSKDSRFSNVAVPISALVGAGDGDFTMTINGAF
ncbi:MAG: hypothetical protein RLZZ342_556 [Candidatus Parcubacteria bacterium]|jgi:hypothetical protein